jgi:predicted dehydrogenase
MDQMLDQANLDALIISTPPNFHSSMVQGGLDHDLHVFCEKPLCLDAGDSEKLAVFARERGLVTQVGYHCRYIGAFQEVRRLLDVGAIGQVTHALAEAYGPVVLKPQGATWRHRGGKGGGSLYDYAAHPLNLLNWYLGEPRTVGGSALNSVFSRETDDLVLGTLFFDSDVTAQLLVDWSDESQRKMTIRITIWGTHGKIFADRQEVQAFLRTGATIPYGYAAGWNVKYNPELTDDVWFYLRGEEYSAQIASFVTRVSAGQVDGVNSFESATATDRTIAKLLSDAGGANSLAASRRDVRSPNGGGRLGRRLPWFRRGGRRTVGVGR